MPSTALDMIFLLNKVDCNHSTFIATLNPYSKKSLPQNALGFSLGHYVPVLEHLEATTIRHIMTLVIKEHFQFMFLIDNNLHDLCVFGLVQERNTTHRQYHL